MSLRAGTDEVGCSPRLARVGLVSRRDFMKCHWQRVSLELTQPGWRGLSDDAARTARRRATPTAHACPHCRAIAGVRHGRGSAGAGGRPDGLQRLCGRPRATRRRARRAGFARSGKAAHAGSRARGSRMPRGQRPWPRRALRRPRPRACGQSARLSRHPRGCATAGGQPTPARRGNPKGYGDHHLRPGGVLGQRRTALEFDGSHPGRPWWRMQRTGGRSDLPLIAREGPGSAPGTIQGPADDVHAPAAQAF